MRTRLLIGALLAVLTIGVFWQVRDFSLLDFDDIAFVRDNPHIQNGLNSSDLRWAFTATSLGNWQPVVWLSYTLDYQINGPDPEVFHLASAALHAANTLLLFWLLLSLTGLPWRSGFVAALFAVHPLHIESVAWVAERKDVLSTLFWFLTMMAYVAYARRKRARFYGLACATFALGLMTKPMLVSVPIVLLLIDFWPLGRFAPDRTAVRKLIVEKLPMFGLAALSCGLTVWTQAAAGAVAALSDYPMGVRLANAGVAYVGYLKKMLWPRDLAVFYPHPGAALPTWQVLGSYALLTAITVLAVRQARRRPYLLTGWLWYLVTLIPVIGIVQVGAQAMADRYTYVPLIGIFVALTWLVADLLGATTARRAAATVVAVGIVVALAAATHSGLRHWRNTETLFTRAIEVTDNNALAHNMLGSTLAARGDADAAIAHYRLAIRYDPKMAAAHHNLATGLYVQGKEDEAMAEYQQAVRWKPDYAEAHSNLGVILADKGRLREAIAHYRAAIKADPDFETARDNLQRALELLKENAAP